MIKICYSMAAFRIQHADAYDHKMWSTGPLLPWSHRDEMGSAQPLRRGLLTGRAKRPDNLFG